MLHVIETGIILAARKMRLDSYIFYKFDLLGWLIEKHIFNFKVQCAAICVGNTPRAYAVRLRLVSNGRAQRAE